MGTRKFVDSTIENGETVYYETTYDAGIGVDPSNWSRKRCEDHCSCSTQRYSAIEWREKTKRELKSSLGLLAIVGIILGGPIIIGLLGMLCNSIFNIASGISRVVYYAIGGGVGTLLLLAFICNKKVRRVVLTLFIVILIIVALLIGMQLFLNGGRL